MKNTWIIPSLIAAAIIMPMASTLLAAVPAIVASSENPALIIKNVQIDPHDGKIRGTVALRFGYGAPLLPHVHVYGLDASGHAISEGCDKLSRSILATQRPAGKARESFSADLGNMASVTKIQVVAEAGHGNDCKREDNRVVKMYDETSSRQQADTNALPIPK